MKKFFDKLLKDIQEWNKNILTPRIRRKIKQKQKNPTQNKNLWDTFPASSIFTLFAILFCLFMFYNFLSSFSLQKGVIYIILALIIVGVSGYYIYKNKPKISGWQIAGWVIALHVILGLGSGIYSLYQKYGPQPKPAGYYNFTQKDYDAKNVHPSNGGGGVFVPIPPNTQGSSGKYQTISFRESHEAKAGVPFYVEVDMVGHAYIPSDEGVWRTITRTHTKYQDEYITFTSKREGTILYVKDYRESAVRHEGVWKVIVDKDMEFALRSLSDERVQIVMQ